MPRAILNLDLDDYLASSRESSQAPTSAPPTPKSIPRSRKRSVNGKPGNRPGRIIQPDHLARATPNLSSKESTTKPGSRTGGLLLARQSSAADRVKANDRSDLVRRASKLLGFDTSDYSIQTLADIIASNPAPAETAQAAPMEIEGGNAPAVMQSTRHVVMEGRYRPRAPTTPDVCQPVSKAHSQAGASAASAAQHSAVALVIETDTETESETDAEDVELGPGDSVSQRLPRTPATAHSTNRTVLPVCPTLKSTANRPAASSPSLFSPYNNALDIAHPIPHAESAEPSSDSDSGCSASSATKRSRPKPLKYSAAHPTSTASHRDLHYNLSQASRPSPPPASDISAVLSWAVRTAQRATTSNRESNANEATALLAKVLEGLQSQFRVSAAPDPNPLSHPSSSNSGQLDYVEDNAEALDAEAKRKLGQHVYSKQKNTLDDYPGVPRRIASLAIPELLVITFTRGPYEVHGTLVDWGYEAYKTTHCRALPDEPFVKPPLELIKIMVRRVSWYRGELKKNLRGPIETEYGFINPPETAEQRRMNRKQAQKLKKENVFHCRELIADEDAYEHPALRKSIAAGFFRGPDSIGIIYHHKFHRIPLPAVAKILTIMQHCISEWGTGVLVPRDLDAMSQAKVYETHLNGLLEYSRPEAAPKRLRRFRHEWAKFGVVYSGGFVDAEPAPASIRADQVRPDTPEPEAVA